MAVKYVEDKKSDFKSIDRDIREHEWAESDFDLAFTDSTCPFEAILSEIREVGMDYYFALNSPERIDRLLIKKWRLVSNDRLRNKRTFSLSFRKEVSDYITTGDVILLEREKKYGDYENRVQEERNIQMMQSTLNNVDTDAVNPYSPFSSRQQ